MATLSPTNSRRLYSWWWDSHISPKNSKWLQENLTDMDHKIKLMIKIIEEDAESFAKRAEMYYRKRPELMNLVEELYRGYRSLAERYDYQAGALRQAHKTMPEAFPDQAPLDLDDDLPPKTAANDTEMQNLDMSQFFLSFIKTGDQNKPDKIADDEDYKKLQKEVSSLSKENQDLKSQVSWQSECCDKAELEIRNLRVALAKVESEKEAAVMQCQQSSARLLNLKAEISHTQEEFKKLKDEMQTGLKSLSTSEERCILLEKTNQNLQLELDRLTRQVQGYEEELNEKNSELEKLGICIQEEQLKSMQTEMASLCLEKQLAESHEKLKLLAMQKQDRHKEIEKSKARLEKELEKIREENRKLDNQNHSAASKIIHLQDEIISFKDKQRRLEEEVSLQVEEKKALRQELCELKDDKSDLEKKHFSFTEQIQAVNFNVESLQALAFQVREGNVELKEIIKNHEGVKLLHVENLRQLERISEKNEDLEKSLSMANAELERLKEKKKALEDSCEYLTLKISSHQSERAVLVSQVEAISQNMEKILEKNLLLENSLSDANVELESLRKKLKGSEESSQRVRQQNTVLRAEKRILVCKVDRINEALRKLEAQHSELQGSHTDMQSEKDSLVNQVCELLLQLKLKSNENADLFYSSKCQFNTLQKQTAVLQEEVRQKEKELEEEEHKIIEGQIEISILKRCLCDMKEANTALSVQLQKHQEDSEEKMNSLSRQNKKLAKGVRSVLEVLKLDEKYECLDQMKDDIVLQLVLHEIQCLLNSISDAQDVKQNQLLEKSLVVTLLEHFGREVADLRSERNSLKQEFQAKSEELSLLQSQKRDLLKINDEFWKEMEASNRKVDELKVEGKFLVDQLSDLQESRRSLQHEIMNLLEENSALSNKLHDAKEKEKTMEDAYSIVLGEAISTDILNVIFQSLHEERTSELQSFHNDFRSLHVSGNGDLYQEIRLINKKLGELEVDNNHLETEITRTVDVCSYSEISAGKKRPARRDRELLKSGRKSQERSLEISNASLQKANELLKEELRELHNEVEVLRSKEKDFTRQQCTVIDVKSCDAEITQLLSNIQMAIMNAALFKEKVLELIITCESFEISEMVQKEIFKEEITRRNSYVDELKDKLNAVEVENRRLKVDLNGDFTLLGSLQSEVDALERQTLSLAKDCISSNKHKNEEFAFPSLHSKTSQKSNDNQSPKKMVKNLELQKLHATIKALQKMVTDTGVLLEQERMDFNASLADARKQVEMLKLKEILDDDMNEVNYEQMLKDIQLDLVQTSSGSKTGSFRQREKRNAAQTDSQMLGFWGVVGANNYTQHEMLHPQSEASEKDKGKRLSSDMIVKELGVDQQDLARTVDTEPHQEWKKKVIERLSSDAQRLQILQSSVQEIKTNIGAYGEDGLPAYLELDSVKAQIIEAEGTVSQLIDTNNKLSKKAEDFTAEDGLNAENMDLRSRSQRKILERARKVSEKIGRLEVELQKIRQILQKHEEELVNKRTKTVQRRSKVQLVEYLYGRRRESRRPKRGPACACMRAKADDD